MFGYTSCPLLASGTSYNLPNYCNPYQRAASHTLSSLLLHAQCCGQYCAQLLTVQATGHHPWHYPTLPICPRSLILTLLSYLSAHCHPQSYPVFNECILSPYISAQFPSQKRQLPPPPDLIEDYEKQKIEEILDSHLERDQLEYLVHWKGFLHEE
ncbi:hypothetical protein BDR03DRAFT_878663 [Suillus americanus]|nr:hypothetical protein BDR03DRAFT_878663 [Suillus americanus]